MIFYTLIFFLVLKHGTIVYFVGLISSHCCVIFWIYFDNRCQSDFRSMFHMEDEILEHFEAEPLARFVYARHEGQCYYSSMTQCFYEVDHRTNLWVKSKNIQENQ